MTQASASTSAGTTDRTALRARRHWLIAATSRALGGLGARLGVGWVFLIGFFAVFAPLLANSKPYLMNRAGQWSSPLLAHLTAADVVLMIVFIGAVVVALLRRLSIAQKTATVVWLFLLSLPLALWPMTLEQHADWAEALGPDLVGAGVWLIAIGLGIALVAVPLALARPGLPRAMLASGGLAAAIGTGWLVTSYGLATALIAALVIAAGLAAVSFPAGDPRRRQGRKWLVGWACFAPLLGIALAWVNDLAAALQPLGPAVFYAALGLLGLLILAGLVGLPLMLGFGRGHLAALIGVALVLGSLLIAYPIDPPQAVVHERERELAAEGELDFVLWAPIPYSPNDRLRDQWELTHPLSPSWVQLFGVDAGDQTAGAHLLGTDRFGADILSNLIHASRVALAVGFIAESISLVVGVFIGALMGYFAGLVDLFGLRLVEVFSAIPRLFLLLAFVAFFGRNIYLIMAIIGATGWPGYAYFVRAEFLRLRQQDFVTAAIATDAPLRSILFRHMLPNGMAPVLVMVGFGVASAILYESTLSFLGVGALEQASWGSLLDQAVSPGGGFYWWLASFPGLAIFFTVFAFNLVGEAMRDAIDPHTVD